MSRTSIYSGSGNPRKGLRRTPRMSGMTRLQEHTKNNLGVIMTDQTSSTKQLFRDDMLDLYDAYYENRAYCDLPPWDEALKESGYTAVRDRAPRVIYNVAKVLVDKVASKITGTAVFPQFVIEDDADDTEYFRQVQKAVHFRKSLMQPVKHTLISGSCFIRYFIVQGVPRIEHFNTKFCYPQFDATGELDTIEVRYVYEDQTDRLPNGNYRMKWYRLQLTKDADILFDSPEYRPGAGLPDFKVVEQNNHNLGWVQGEWLRTSEHKFSSDGSSLFGEILDFIDDINYSLSQSSQATSYNQEPQLVFKGMDEDEIETLIRSSQKGWNLGRENASAEFLESDLGGIKTAEEQRDHNRQFMLDVARVVLHDPEKMQASAQSGKALEVLNAPLVELVDELRTMFEVSFKRLLIKLGMTILQVSADGFDTIIETPPGYMPSSLDINVIWPPVYPATLEDIQKKVAAVVSATNGHLISHETGTRFIAKDFGVEDIEEELSKIQTEGETMPWLNPFGGMGFGGQ